MMMPFWLAVGVKRPSLGQLLDQLVGDQLGLEVDRAHRGHRLVALVKTGMLLWMRDAPALAQLDT
jgi:hypothetical protein